MSTEPRGRYFDDFKVGDEFVSPGRTLTEADIVAFAGLSWDLNPLHTDEEWARANTPFGGRIAHGMLVASVATGLANQLALFEGTTIALLEVTTRWPAPTLPGDTLHAVVRITDLTPSSKPDRGVVTCQVEARNQKGTTVMESTWKVLMKRRGA